MIEELLSPLVCARFKNDPHYRERHLRVINALPGRKVTGLHIPDMKQTAAVLCREDGEGWIRRFTEADADSLSYEETVIWGYIINKVKVPLEKRMEMLSAYIPVLDNWAVCDSFCASAKWMGRTDKDILWEFLQRWFGSGREFEVRFAIISSMCHFLVENRLDAVFSEISGIRFDRIVSEYGDTCGKSPYYVRMATAWLLATALAKFPDRTRAYAASSPLPEDVIRLYVRKARESYRTRGVRPL